MIWYNPYPFHFISAYWSIHNTDYWRRIHANRPVWAPNPAVQSTVYDQDTQDSAKGLKHKINVNTVYLIKYMQGFVLLCFVVSLVWGILMTPNTFPISHNTLFCNRNVHMCAHFCYKMVHCGILPSALWDVWDRWRTECWIFTRCKKVL